MDDDLRPDETHDAQLAIGILLGCAIVFRVCYLAILPVDLVHDEAYYWDWSRHLDWCYYSKPPGIAWLIALSTRTGVSSAFFVRLPAALLSTLTIYLAYSLGRRLYGPRVGLLAAALICASPGNAASGVVMTIDSPLLCCWVAALFCFWRMLERDQDRMRWAIATSLSVGFGLLFKQTMLAFPVLAGSFVVLSREDRPELKRWSFWTCGLLALAFAAPVLWWNYHHDWITFAHTNSHFQGEAVSWWRRMSRGGEFIGSQLALVAPVTYVLLTVVAYQCLAQWKALTRKELFLIWFWLGPVFAISLLSFKQRVEPNWPAPFYISAFVLLAGYLVGRLPVHVSAQRSGRAIRLALGVGAVSVLLTYALPFLILASGSKGSKFDVCARMWGWRELAHDVDRVLSAQPQAADHPLLVVADRSVASELAFYLPHQPHVHLWDHNGRIDTQYDVWGHPEDLFHQRVVVVSDEPTLPLSLMQRFQRVDALGSASSLVGNAREHRVQLWSAVPFDGLPDVTPSLQISRRESIPPAY